MRRSRVLSTSESENNKGYLPVIPGLNIPHTQQSFHHQICSVIFVRRVYLLTIITVVISDISNLITGKTIVDKCGAARANCSLRNTSVHATAFFCKGIYKLKHAVQRGRTGNLSQVIYSSMISIHFRYFLCRKKKQKG